MPNDTQSLVQTLLKLPVFRSEWVLYLLIALSVISIGVMLERWIFYTRRKLDIDAMREALQRNLDRGNFAGAAKALADKDALETNVVLVGLKAYEKGPESVEDLIAGALGREKGALRKAPRLPGHAGQQRALHRPVRHRARHRAVVPRPGGQHGRREQRGHGRHRGGADRHRGRPAGRHPGGRRVQRVQGAREHVGHRLPDAGAHPARQLKSVEPVAPAAAAAE